ncbi:hypothetical protein GCM10009097_39130 [Pigmentiphaga daeguensis]|uniref:Uncharacterized protein n=1 Tax=Pigmentiphaga daeguensis TaxID=414049 RepID=A0ABP3MCS5_9BURK
MRRPTTLAAESVALPAWNGTIIRTGRSGQASWARAGVQTAASAAAQPAVHRLMESPPLAQ